VKLGQLREILERRTPDQRKTLEVVVKTAEGGVPINRVVPVVSAHCGGDWYKDFFVICTEEPVVVAKILKENLTWVAETRLAQLKDAYAACGQKYISSAREQEWLEVRGATPPNERTRKMSKRKPKPDSLNLAITAFLERQSPDDDAVEVLTADGFDEAFVGVVERFNEGFVACYDRAKCIEILEKQGMSNEDAEEYFSFNVAGAWVGAKTPFFFHAIEVAKTKAPKPSKPKGRRAYRDIDGYLRCNKCGALCDEYSNCPDLNADGTHGEGHVKL
jgi:hypothetical protein